ncbi:MAG TPA: UDP-N-acetylmuramoyl-tripeptide--D-alanyl-D-alanine ligase [Dehalococcoidia bacterium]|nr:UDP-N-acetylmuramoyl-tripeptide--D-alanyl-D-alanine ligase [Dehalococcoidia bacterium]
MLAVPDVWEGTRRVLVASRGPAGAAFQRGVIDSREAGPGDLFFALRGERHDGHDFVAEALARGAAGAVVERPLEVPEDAALFHVSDSLQALQELAAHWRRRHDVRVIAVTGSVGKTTCKELIASVLGSRYAVLKSEANLNTEIGVPLTLLRLAADHERAVLELAMHARGEIALLARIAQPQVGVVTSIGPVHLERLGTLGAIVAAKAELVEALPADGVAILNGDDASTAGLAARTRARVLFYGQSEQCHVRGSEVVSRGLDGISFRLTFGEASVTVSSPLPGRHHLYPCLAAAAVALVEGMTLDEIAVALASARPDLRLRVLEGPGGSTIIDDSYNASPASMLAALDLLGEMPGRRIALLGEMRELGAAEEEGHREVGEQAATACDVLIVVGQRTRPLAEAARAAGHRDVRFVESVAEAAVAARSELRGGGFLLVKASRALALEGVVDALVAT